MSEIVISIIVVSVLLLILMLVLTFSVKRINSTLKKIYVDKLQQYDFLIKDKEEKSHKLEDEIQESEKIYEGLKNKINENNLLLESNGFKKDVVVSTNADLQDDNIFTGYKRIKEHFNFNTRQIVTKFVQSHEKDEDKEYIIYKRVRAYFTYNTIYKISSFKGEDQKTIIKEMLNDDEKKCLQSLLIKKRFNTKKFVQDLDELILKTSTLVKVYVGDKKENYDDVSDRVKTIFDDKIVDGFKIEYRGIVYDYSI